MANYTLTRFTSPNNPVAVSEAGGDLTTTAALGQAVQNLDTNAANISTTNTFSAAQTFSAAANLNGGGAIAGTFTSNASTIFDGTAANDHPLQIQGTGTNGALLKLLGNGSTTPSKQIQVQSGTLRFMNDGFSLMSSFYDSGCIAVGSPTGGDKGAGTINVATAVYLNGTAYTNPDFVFEHHYSGKILTHKNKRLASGYRGLPTLAEIEADISRSFRLPYMADEFGPDGKGHDIFSGGEALLLHLEQAFLYLIDHDKRLKALGG